MAFNLIYHLTFRDSGRYRFETVIKLLNAGGKNAILNTHSNLLYQYNIRNITNFQICRERYVGIPIVMYAKKNFYLLPTINDKIELLRGAGLIEYWHSLSFIEKSLNQQSNTPKILTMGHLSGCFIIWIGGCFISCFAFIFEFIISKWKKRKD